MHIQNILFEHSEYMIVYKIVNLWNVNIFPNFSILKICYFSKFGKYLEFSKLKICRIFQIANSFNFPNFKFLEFYKLDI